MYKNIYILLIILIGSHAFPTEITFWNPEDFRKYKHSQKNLSTMKNEEIDSNFVMEPKSATVETDKGNVTMEDRFLVSVPCKSGYIKVYGKCRKTFSNFFIE